MGNENGEDDAILLPNLLATALSGKVAVVLTQEEEGQDDIGNSIKLAYVEQLLYQNRFDEAIQAINVIDPNEIEGKGQMDTWYANILYILVFQDRGDDILKLVEILMEVDPTSTVIFEMVYKYYCTLSNFESPIAEKIFEMAIEINPKIRKKFVMMRRGYRNYATRKATIFSKKLEIFGLFKRCLKAGDTAMALECYDMIMDLHPENDIMPKVFPEGVDVNDLKQDEKQMLEYFNFIKDSADVERSSVEYKKTADIIRSVLIAQPTNFYGLRAEVILALRDQNFIKMRNLTSVLSQKYPDDPDVLLQSAAVFVADIKCSTDLNTFRFMAKIMKTLKRRDDLLDGRDGNGHQDVKRILTSIGLPSYRISKWKTTDDGATLEKMFLEQVVEIKIAITQNRLEFAQDRLEGMFQVGFIDKGFHDCLFHFAIKSRNFDAAASVIELLRKGSTVKKNRAYKQLLESAKMDAKRGGDDRLDPSDFGDFSRMLTTGKRGSSNSWRQFIRSVVGLYS